MEVPDCQNFSKNPSSAACCTRVSRSYGRGYLKSIWTVRASQSRWTLRSRKIGAKKILEDAPRRRILSISHVNRAEIDSSDDQIARPQVYLPHLYSKKRKKPSCTLPFWKSPHSRNKFDKKYKAKPNNAKWSNTTRHAFWVLFLAGLSLHHSSIIFWPEQPLKSTHPEWTKNHPVDAFKSWGVNGSKYHSHSFK